MPASTNPSGSLRRLLPQRILPPGVAAFLRRRAAEIAGLAACALGLTLLIALASHHPGDPSLNTAGAGVARNLAGPAGAVLSDVLLQGVGLAAVLVGITPLVWAWRLVSHRPLGSMLVRLALLAASLPAAAAALSLIELRHASLPAGAGGVLGPLLMGGAQEMLGGWFGPLGLGFATLFLVGLGVLLPLASFGLSAGEWRGAGRVVAAGGGAVAAGAGEGAGKAGRAMTGFWQRLDLPARFSAWRARRAAAAAEARPAYRREAPLEPTIPVPEPASQPGPSLPEAGEPAGLAPAPPVAAPATEPRPRVAPSPEPRRAASAGQGALPLAGGWVPPPLALLAAPPANRPGRPTEESLEANARLLEGVLADFGVQGKITAIRPGPVVTLYEVEPAPGTKSARVIGLADDIARSMSVLSVRVAVVPGRNAIGIEMPNSRRETVWLSELFSSEAWVRARGRLNLALGKDIGGAPEIVDLAAMPHLLIAGTTGSGKSVAINTMILSLVMRLSPEECRLIMIDPKMLELSVYDRIPHLLAPVVTEPAKAVGALKWAVREMERRYRLMSQLGVRNVGGYNARVAEARAKGETISRRVQTGYDPETGKPTYEDQPLALDPLPFIVIVVDEMADLMLVAGKEIEATVQRLAQMARAAGIHILMATQRPSVDVITGVIKANFPTRISFRVVSKVDSRTILNEQGAEQLLGQGDMLRMGDGGRIVRVHGPFVSDSEVERVVAHLRSLGEPDYVDEVTEADATVADAGAGVPGLGLDGPMGEEGDENSLYDQAVALVAREGKASTSFIQRHLQIGYNRAARLIERMEKEGVVGPPNHVGRREILVRRTNED
ncbi:MAG: DNA translocase FtsK [Acetobacteraceae bacterium]|nr:DNA translocase FtsK [Acetobacteraceae bacterium]